MPNFPKQYTPVIGSLNAELAEYATQRGKSIPTPDECVEIVRNYGKPPVVEKVQPYVVEKPAESDAEVASFWLIGGIQYEKQLFLLAFADFPQIGNNNAFS